MVKMRGGLAGAGRAVRESGRDPLPLVLREAPVNEAAHPRFEVGEAVPEDVPKHHLAVEAGGGERAPVRAERNPGDTVLAAGEGCEPAVVVVGVPEHNRTVVAGGGERAPIRAERDAGDGVFAAEGGELAVAVS